MREKNVELDSKNPVKTKDKETKNYTYEEGGGIDTDGTPTEDESLLVVEEETVAKRSATGFHVSEENREESNKEGIKIKSIILKKELGNYRVYGGWVDD